jgi:uncharacterized Zn-binding protein involved in type VI secretion
MGRPAARVGDLHVCPMITPGVPPVPHVGGPILPPGVVNILIGSMPAAVVGNLCTCVGPPDAIAFGSIGVFFGGMPAARMGDSTVHGGVITTGLPTVLIGDIGGDITQLGGSLDPAMLAAMAEAFGNGGPLTPEQAQALFNIMASQPDIAFAYPIDGCYARAHIMSERMKQMGVNPTGKVWSFAPDPASPLHAKTANDPNGYVEWGYHVAPTVSVKDANGNVSDKVIDPSLFNRPVSPQEWADAQRPTNGSNPILRQTIPGQSPLTGEMNGNDYWPAPSPPDVDAAAAETMREYKIEQRRSRGSFTGGNP